MTKTLSEQLSAILAEHEKYVLALETLILSADITARRRGDEFGLCDCIDNDGGPYPSQWSADIIKAIRQKAGASLPRQTAVRRATP